jgi:hypothetical protein
LDNWGAPMRKSQPVTIDYLQTHTLEITMGSLAVVDDATLVQPIELGRVRLKIDDVQVWDEPAYFFAAEPEEIAVGRNPIGGTASGPLFSGEILRAARVVR